MAEIEKFSPSSYMDKLRDRMKQTLIDVIPDEQWDAMIKAEVDAFFQDKVENRGYYSNNNGSTVTPSTFKQAVHGVLTEECRKRVTQMIQSDGWAGYWDGQKQVAGQKIVDVVREYGAEIMGKWITSAVQQVIQQIQFMQVPR